MRGKPAPDVRIQGLAHGQAQRATPGQLHQLVQQPLAAVPRRHLRRALAAAQRAAPSRAEQRWRPRVDAGEDAQHRRCVFPARRRHKRGDRSGDQSYLSRRAAAVDVHNGMDVDPRNFRQQRPKAVLADVP